MKLLYYKMESTVDSYEKKHYYQDSMSINVHIMKRILRNELEIWKLIGTKILVLPADTVA